MRELSVPFSPEDLATVLQVRDSEEFSINYATSNITGVGLICYLSNLKVKCTIDLTGVPRDDIISLTQAFLTAPVMFDSPTTNELIQNTILYVISGNSVKHLPTDRPDWQDSEFFDALLSVCQDTIFDMVTFIHSVPAYVMDLDKDNDTPRDRLFNFEVDDVSVVPKNVVWVFKDDMFIKKFFSLTPSLGLCLVYYRQQFEQTVFNGRTLYDHIITNSDGDPNWLIVTVLAAVDYLNGVDINADE